MDKKSESFTPTPPMSEFVKALLPSGVEEDFRRAFADGNIDFFFDNINAAMADADANPVAALKEVKVVLGYLLVAVIQCNRNDDSKLGLFGKYEGPADIRNKWKNVCGSDGILFPNVNGQKIRRMCDGFLALIAGHPFMAASFASISPDLHLWHVQHLQLPPIPCQVYYYK